jgi:endonuclease G
MKQLLFIFIALQIVTVSQAQTVDTVIHKDNYTSYYSYSLHNPLFVVYKLFKGGGSCSRINDRFITDNLPLSATAKDYAASGYDEGHLADSKDFAYDCKLQEETFRFYNCVPQTPALNRGIWKHFETLIRKESQTDSLLIIAG